MHAHIELPLALPPPPTGPRFVSLGGRAAIEPSVLFFFFCQQGDLQTIHGRRTHSHLPPSYTLTFLPQTHSHLCEELQYARKKNKKKPLGVRYSLQTTAKIVRSTWERGRNIHILFEWDGSVNQKRKWRRLTRLSDGVQLAVCDGDNLSCIHDRFTSSEANTWGTFVTWTAGIC